jgi:serine/threonine protein kinase|tara:strand:+ start:494 stop:1330 length:837 start_codon:yes stop_codon:yes gene_type:complete
VYAVKSLSKAQILGAQLQHHVMQERDVMKDCDSPFTVRLVATFQDRAMLYMCMETVMGGELFNHLARVGGALHEDTARFYAACVVLAFQYLQAKHYVYRDLKPENLLIDRNGFLKIADFGFAKRLLPGEKTYTLCGTPEYMSPELYKQSGHNKGVDWWALGVLIYEMVVGAPPFYSPGGDGETQWRRILVAKYSFPSGVTPHFKDIVRRLLTVNSVQRLGCLKGGVKDVKLHPWLRSVDWVSLAQRTHAAPFVPPVRSLQTCVSPIARFRHSIASPFN